MLYYLHVMLCPCYVTTMLFYTLRNLARKPHDITHAYYVLPMLCDTHAMLCSSHPGSITCTYMCHVQMDYVLECSQCPHTSMTKACVAFWTALAIAMSHAAGSCPASVQCAQETQQNRAD